MASTIPFVSDTPRKRGRPRKIRPEATQPGAGTGTVFDIDLPEDFLNTDTQLPGTKKKRAIKEYPSGPGNPYAQARHTRQSKPEAAFLLEKRESVVLLSLVDRKGKPVVPDYRRYAGLARDAVRDYSVRLSREADVFHWNANRGAGDQPHESGGLAAPEPRLLDLAAQAGMLVDRSGLPITVPDHEASLVIAVEKSKNGTFKAALQLSAAESENAAPRDRTIPLSVSPRHALCGQLLYSIPDLGPEWQEDLRSATNIKREDLPVILSLALSRLNGLGLEFPPYSVVRTSPRTAKPALVFSAVDAYGYLHIRPVSTLPGYPPGFFEERDIMRVVEIDDDENEIRIADVLFPAPVDETFRSLFAGLGKAAKNGVFEEGGYFILSPDFAERFLSESMGKLMDDFLLFESEKLATFRIRPSKPRLRLSLASGIDFLEGSALVEIGGETFSYARFLKDVRRQSYIELSDGTRAYPERSEVDRFERILRRVRGDDDLVRVSFFDYPLLAGDGSSLTDGDAWKRPEAFYRGYNSIHARSAAASQGAEGQEGFSVREGELRPYQNYGALWMDYLRSHGLGACLADEMGLGKTVQTIALLRKVYREGETAQSLVVMPRSLLFNWMAEFARFAPELRVSIHHGVDRSARSLADTQIILTTYAILRHDADWIEKIDLCYLVLDESQTIKNAGTKTTHAVLRLKSRHRLALSGTPIENNLGELYSLFSFLNPGMFGIQSDFMERYIRPIQDRGDEEALHDLKTRIFPFLLRRMKKDVLPELPEKSEQVSWIELDENHLALYHRRRAELKTAIEKKVRGEGLARSRLLILQAFTELRRLASVPEAEWDLGTPSSKREFLKERIPEISQNGHKCLVFTNYLASVELISRDLTDLGIENLVMTGATGDRQSLVRQFQTDPAIKAFVMTLKTGGLGLNLTAADYVFIFDPWWNRSAESQAIDRTHRMGQRNPVFCYRLIAKDTIEEKILKLQEMKTGLVSSLISSDTDAFKTLDEGDIDYLLDQ